MKKIWSILQRGWDLLDRHSGPLQAIGVLITLAVGCGLIAFGGRLWKWSTETIQQYPAQMLCSVLLVVVVLLLRHSLLQGRFVKLLIERSARAEGLEVEVTEWKSSCEKLAAALAKKADPISKQERLAITAIYAHGSATLAEIGREIGLTEAQADGLLRDLRLTSQLVARFNRGNGSEEFRLTEDGEEYVKKQGIKPTA